MFLCLTTQDNAIYYWAILHVFLLSADFFFFKLTVQKNSLRNTIKVSNNSVRPDLGSNCCKNLSAPVILLSAYPASFAHNFVSGMQSVYFSKSQDAIVLQTCH